MPPAFVVDVGGLFHMVLLQASRLLPVFVVLEGDIPNSAAVLHEGRRHVADALDGADIGTLHLIINGILLHAGKEGVETVLVGLLVGSAQPYKLRE